MVPRIRPAEPADLAALSRLLVTQLREHDVSLPEAGIAAGAAGMLRRPQRGRFLVAEVGGRLVGFAALSFLWTLEHGGRAAWLDGLYVVPEERGRGLGEALLDAALATAAAAGARAVDLEIEAGHERVESLYRRRGFAALTRTRWARQLAAPAPAARPLAPVLEGGCFCGALRYQAAGPVRDVAHCHCSICRRTTGAPFVTWATVPIAGFRFSAGAPGSLRATPWAERQRCSACGTALTFRELAQPDWIDVTVASLDDPGAVSPDKHIWTADQVRWLHLDDDLPRFPQRS